MPTFELFAQDLNEAVSGYVARLDARLQALGPIGLQDTVLTRRLDLNTIRYELTLSYQQPGTASMRAAFFAATTAQSVDAQVAAAFALLPSARIVFVHDVSQERRRKLDHDSVMVIYTETLVPNCGQDRSRPVIVEANALIAAGASGSCTLVTASGLTADVITVLNRSGAAWAAGKRGYAAARPGTCIWDGYPTCC